jgi:hypothetical protein
MAGRKNEHRVQRTGLNARTRAGIINPRLFIGEQIIIMAGFHAIMKKFFINLEAY